MVHVLHGINSKAMYIAEDFQFSGPQKLYKKDTLCMHNCEKHAHWAAVGRLVRSMQHYIERYATSC